MTFSYTHVAYFDHVPSLVTRPYPLLPTTLIPFPLLQSFTLIEIIFLLTSTYEDKHEILDFLNWTCFTSWWSQASFFFCEWCDFILLCGWIIYVHTYIHMYMFTYTHIWMYMCIYTHTYISPTLILSLGCCEWWHGTHGYSRCLGVLTFGFIHGSDIAGSLRSSLFCWFSCCLC